MEMYRPEGLQNLNMLNAIPLPNGKRNYTSLQTLSNVSALCARIKETTWHSLAHPARCEARNGPQSPGGDCGYSGQCG